MKLSIIIPVFNGEKYLLQCLNSLKNQLNDDVELIIINDGSTDHSDQIIKVNYQEEIKLNQIKYFSTENQGVSSARNIGIDQSTGKYLTFIDCDDLVEPHYISTILQAINNDACIIEFGYKTIDEKDQLLLDNQFLHREVGLFAKDAHINKTFAACIWYSPIRVIKKSIISETRYPKGVKFCEDLIFLVECYQKANKFECLDKVLYQYRINQNGATRNISIDYAKPLIDYYYQQMKQNSLSSMMIRINLAYVIRRCLGSPECLFAKLPSDIQHDLYRMILNLKLISLVKKRMFLFAVFGNTLSKIKKVLGK